MVKKTQPLDQFCCDVPTYLKKTVGSIQERSNRFESCEKICERSRNKITGLYTLENLRAINALDKHRARAQKLVGFGVPWEDRAVSDLNRYVLTPSKLWISVLNPLTDSAKILNWRQRVVSAEEIIKLIRRDVSEFDPYL
jgi:hypothetical protein